MKKLRSNIITLVIVSALVLFFVLKDDFDEIISVLLSANKLYIFKIPFNQFNSIG